MNDEQIAAELADILYRIEPDEVPLIAPSLPVWRPSKRQRRKLRKLKRTGNRQSLKRFKRKLQKARRRFNSKYHRPNASDVIMTEWLVQELYPDRGAGHAGLDAGRAAGAVDVDLDRAGGGETVGWP